MRCKRILILILVVIALMCMTSCQKTEKLGEPPVPMEKVTVDTMDHYITMELEVPKDWYYAYFDQFDSGYFNLEAMGFSESDPNTWREMEYRDVPYQLRILTYNPGNNNEIVTERYENLFRGDYKNFENFHSDILDERYKNLFGEDYEKIFDENDKDSESIDNNTDTVREYKQYRGKNGKIVVVYSTFPYETGEGMVHQIECYREDIPYVVYGAFDDSEDYISSGEIALWVADSLEVTEHFTIGENGGIQPPK